MNDFESLVKPDTAGLVAVINRRIDLDLAHAKQWYRIPVRSAPAGLNDMRWVAFYLTAPFGGEKWSVRHWASITSIREARRVELLPDEPDHPRAQEAYYRLALGQVQQRHEPILSRRRRRVVFIPSVWRKFQTALEINDLHNGSPLEDRLWAAFKQEGIEAERQWFEGTTESLYCLDFAVFCPQRNIDVECDGDLWHSNPKRAREDNQRNNFLEQRGWHVLRFSTDQLMSTLPDCLQAVKTTVRRCGGLCLPDGTVRQFGGALSQTDRSEVLDCDSVRLAHTRPAAKTESTTRQAEPELGERSNLSQLLAATTATARKTILTKLESVHGSDGLARGIASALPGLTPREKERGVWCLGELRPNSAAVDGLIVALASDTTRNLRRLAYSACAKLRRCEFEEPILARLSEEEQQVLQYALSALAECGTEVAIKAIRQVLSRAQPDYVTKSAQEALRRCTLRKKHNKSLR